MNASLHLHYGKQIIGFGDMTYDGYIDHLFVHKNYQAKEPTTEDVKLYSDQLLQGMPLLENMAKKDPIFMKEWEPLEIHFETKLEEAKSSEAMITVFEERKTALRNALTTWLQQQKL